MEKELWTEKDFEFMGWNECRIYSISFPNEKHEIVLDIDYIFRMSFEGDSLPFLIAPCIMHFSGVEKFAMNTDTKNNMQSYILNISKTYIRDTQNGAVKIWEYLIEGDFGTITLHTTGFKMRLLRQPIESLDIDLWSYRNSVAY